MRQLKTYSKHREDIDSEAFHELHKIPSVKQRIIYLFWALGMFACLYPLTNFYSEILNISQPYQHWQVIPVIDNAIPFIDWMIVPYSWSLPLFICSFFIVANIRQLRILSSRLILTTLIACLCFYLLPLQFSFLRSDIRPLFVPFYAFIEATDRPYNQLPSLHAAYAIILLLSLWPALAVVKQKWLTRLLLVVVCTFIALSTLFTYQHHILDVIAGFLLAVIVVFLVSKIESLPALKFISVALITYLVLNIAAFLYFNATIQFIIQILSCYCLASFLLTAYCYQNSCTTLFQKTKQGRLRLLSCSLFAPLFFIYQCMSYWRYWFIKPQFRVIQLQRYSTTIDSVSIEIFATPKLYYGEVEKLTIHKQLNTDQTLLIVIDSSSEVNSHYSYLHSRNLLTQQFSQLEYLYFPLLDLQPLTNRQFEPILQLMQCIAQAIGKAKMPYTHISLNFHCVMGWSRSVALMICYLVHCQQLSPRRTDIFNWLNRYYPDAHVRAEYLSLTLLELLHEHGKTVNAIQDGFELIQKNRSAGKR